MRVLLTSYVYILKRVDKQVIRQIITGVSSYEKAISH